MSLKKFLKPWVKHGDKRLPENPGDVFVVQHEKYGFFWSRVLYPRAKHVRSQTHVEFAVVESYRVVSKEAVSIPPLDRENRVKGTLFLPFDSWQKKYSLNVGNVPFAEGVWRPRAARSINRRDYRDQMGEEIGQEEVKHCMPIGPSATDTVGFLAGIQQVYEEDPDSFIRID